jgi:hypothetical protein
MITKISFTVLFDMAKKKLQQKFFYVVHVLNKQNGNVIEGAKFISSHLSYFPSERAQE